MYVRDLPQGQLCIPHMQHSNKPRAAGLTLLCMQMLKERKLQHNRQQRGKQTGKGKAGRGRPDAGDESSRQPRGRSTSTKKGFMGASKAAGKSANKAGRARKGRR